MVKPERMVKCRVVAPKNYLSKVISALYDLGLYHLTPHLKTKEGSREAKNSGKGKDEDQEVGENKDLNQDLDIGNPLQDAEQLSTILVKIRSILAKFPETRAKGNLELTSENIKSITSKVDKAYEGFIQTEEKLKSFAEEQENIYNNLVALAILKKLDIDIKTLSNSSVLCHFFGTITKSQGLEEAIGKVSDECSVAKNSKHLLLVGKLSEQEKLKEVLSDFGFIPFNFEFNFTDLIKEVNSKKVQLRKIKEDKEAQERNLISLKANLPQFADLSYKIQEEIKKQELPLKFAVTKSSFVATGWIPKKHSLRVQKKLEEVTNNKVSVAFTEPDKKEEPPVKLHNKKLVTPFEFLMRLYDLPKYNEIDPSSLLFLTFPFFFGLMLGDFGYGAVLFGVFWFLKKKIPEGKQLLSVLMFAAVVSMIFGLVFGEVFGFEHVSVETGKALCDSVGICLPQHEINVHGVVHQVADFPRFLNRAHGHINILGFEILTILVIGAIIGFIHVNLGFVFGFINELQSHGLKHAIMAKGSWIIIQIGIILAVLAKLGMLIPAILWLGIIVGVIGVALLAIGEGVQGVVELPAIFSNTLSYMRLGAVGLASVGLAVVVNEELALPFIAKGGWFILVGILIMILGHGINILLGVIGPFLHGVRLHYVEFFSKFFHGGGEEYDPFTKGDEK